MLAQQLASGANGDDKAVVSNNKPHQDGHVMKAIAVSDRDAGVAGLSFTDLPHPEPASNDVIVRVHAASFISNELDWPDTWTDRAGRDRTPSVPGHDLSGVVVELGFGLTGLSVVLCVFGFFVCFFFGL